MPSKYERFKIETIPAPHVYQIPNKFDVSARKVRLAAMLVHEAFEYKLNKEVVLSRPCIYGVFGGRFGGFKPLKHKCVGCMRCVQEYPHIMAVKQSDEYKTLGDSFWTPEAVFTIWNEASTGKIPVKGMGYKGAFGGEGFDGMWTDMSEIVRPTRDGVYGREYISTCVDIGRKPTRVDFGKIDQSPSSVQVPVPIIFDDLPALEFDVWNAVGKAARKLGTFFVTHDQTRGEDYRERMIPIVDDNSLDETLEKRPSIVEYDGERSDLSEKLSDSLQSSIVIARVPLREESGLVACKLAREGVPACTQPKDRKSTRLNSSHLVISYAVFCLKKKKNIYYKLSAWRHDGEGTDQKTLGQLSALAQEPDNPLVPRFFVRMQSAMYTVAVLLVLPNAT